MCTKILKFMTKTLILNPLNLKSATRSDHVLPKILWIDFDIQGTHHSDHNIPSYSISCLNLLSALEMMDPNQVAENSMKNARCLHYLLTVKMKMR